MARLFQLSIFWLIAGGSAMAQPYVAAYDSGNRLRGQVLSQWYEHDGEPLLDDAPLIPEEAFLRWFQNRALRPTPQDAGGFVEFIGGDRLPGRVTEYLLDEDTPAEPRLAVMCRTNWSKPSETSSPEHRVLLKYVRRVSWENESKRTYEPGVLFLKDGGRLPFRRLRWLARETQILTGEGERTIPFEDLSEIHLPQQNEWDVIRQEQASWGNAGSLRMEATPGLIISASAESFAAMAYAERDEDRLQILQKLARVQRFHQSLLDRQSKSKSTHKRRMAEIEGRVTKAQAAFDTLLEQMRPQLKELPEAEAAKKIATLREPLDTRIKREQARREQFEGLHERASKKYIVQIVSTGKQLEQLQQQLAATEILSNPGNWFHAVQPVWSDVPLWLRFTTIRSRLAFHAGETPLTRLLPSKALQQSTFGAGLTWRNGASVLGGELRSGGKAYGWGFGVHADNELEFELPPGAKTFRTLIALDDTVGDGGCASAAIYLNDRSGKPIYESPLLIGSTQVYDTGDLSLQSDNAPPTGRQRLILVVHSKHKDRPANADPYDVRDHVNWLEPIVK